MPATQVQTITYADKVRKGTSGATAGVTDTVRAVDMNEIKNVMNNNSEVTQQAYDTAMAAYEQLNPLTVTLNHDKPLQLISLSGANITVNLNWTITKAGVAVGNDDITSIELKRGDTIITTDKTLRSFADTFAVPSSPSTITYTLKVISKGSTKTATKTLQFVAATYYGPVTNLAMTDVIAKGLTPSTQNSKGKTITGINLSNQRFAYVYPQAFGALTSISDGVLPYIDSFTQTTLTIDGVAYYSYVMTEPTTASNAKLIFA